MVKIANRFASDPTIGAGAGLVYHQEYLYRLLHGAKLSQQKLPALAYQSRFINDCAEKLFLCSIQKAAHHLG
jgi:hypothetical protein